MSGAMTLPQAAVIPPLLEGDCLSRAEFERRYDAMPARVKAELIEGVVYMASPARYHQHGKPSYDFAAYLATYSHFTPGTGAAGGSTVRLNVTSELQPDAALFVLGGNAWIDEDDYICGAPELLGEFSASTVKSDLGVKLTAYRRAGVKEYVIWRTEAKALDWFILRNDEYDRLKPEGGILRSEAFPGLWIDETALRTGNHPRVHEVLQQGLASPEHAAFVAKLAERSSDA